MKRIIVGLMMCVLIGSALGDVMISEIMYDPSGIESKKEWIELYNNGTLSVDMNGWKLNDGTAKNLTLYRGSFILQEGSFAVIARNGENFTKEYPAYFGTIFENSFELTNNGKNISILNKAGILVDKIKYADISNEDYSVEVSDASYDNSIFENWMAGPYRGDPGNIRKAQNTVPEFGKFGTIIALVGCVIIFLRKGY
jgi:hypothetical protein